MISVITIVFNDKNNILKTMDSIINQTYNDIQYIIIDGKSNDGTKEIIENKIKNIADTKEEKNTKDLYYLKSTKKDNKKFSFVFISQNDNGIYDAMNKGIQEASGKYCNFMNSGDLFFCDKTLENAINKLKNDSIVIYGDTKIFYDDKNSKILLASHDHRFHHKFIHQSSLIKTNILKQYKFDTRFKIAGDTKLFTMLYHKKYKFQYINEIISIFNLDGVSSKISYQMFKEDCMIGYKYNKAYPIFNTIKWLFRDIPRYIFRISLPKNIRNKARVMLSKDKV